MWQIHMLRAASMKFSMTNHVGCWLTVVMSFFNAFSVPLPQQPVTTETQKAR
jgi:hypothetical protein